MTDEMPVSETYKGVAIFAGQPSKRIRLVRKEIDKVSRITGLEQLFQIAGDCSWSPESRLYARARLLAGLELATERRQARPDINREDVEACTAGLAVRRWAHPDRFCSLLDMHPERASLRDDPLDDDEE